MDSGAAETIDLPADTPAFREIAATVDGRPSVSIGIGRGWHYLENAGESYRWTTPEFELEIGDLAECLVLDYARADSLGAADCLVEGPNDWVELPVRTGRHKLIVDLAPLMGGPGRLRFALSKTGRVVGDAREFGLCVFGVALVNGVEANRMRREKAEFDMPSTVRHLPTELSIASTDKCNLRCVMCGTHHAQTGDNNAGRPDLSNTLVRKVDALSGGAESIQMHGGAGEPLFNPEFWQLVGGFANVPGRNIEIHTNALLFNPRNIAMLMKSAITHVSVSFDAASEEMYRKVRGGDHARLLRNVRALAEARRESGRRNLRISANMTVFQANCHEAGALVQLAHDLGLDAVMLMHLNGGDAYNWTETKADGWVFDYRANLPDVDPAHVQAQVAEAVRIAGALNFELIVDTRLQAMEAPAPAAPETPAEAVAEAPPQALAETPAPTVEEPPHAAIPEAASETDEPVADDGLKYSDCRKPWKWLNIAANGDVYPCCWAAQPLGNLNEVDSLGDIWNGRRMRELRTDIRENRLQSDVCVGASCLYVTRGSAGE